MQNKVDIKSDFSEYTKLFLRENSIHNLISKNDEKYLYEKHIYDSLSIKLFFEKHNFLNPNILDIGCGGGFPCVPVAIEYPNYHITGIDSIRKKIESVKSIKDQLNIKNLDLICDRAENIKNNLYDIVLSRAVGDLAKIASYSLPLTKKGGYFIAYKSKKAEEEIISAQNILKKYNAKIEDIIEYTLPTVELYERKLICIKKN